VHEFVQANVAQRYMRHVRRVARWGDGIDGAAGLSEGSAAGPSVRRLFQSARWGAARRAT
jgi:hypothetical protein